MKHFLTQAFLTLTLTACALAQVQESPASSSISSVSSAAEKKERLADLSEYVREQHQEITSRPLTEQLEFIRTHTKGVVINDFDLEPYLCQERREQFGGVDTTDPLIRLMNTVKAIFPDEWGEYPLPSLIIAVRDERNENSQKSLCEAYKEELFEPRQRYAKGLQDIENYVQSLPVDGQIKGHILIRFLQAYISDLETILPRTYFPEPVTEKGVFISYAITDNRMEAKRVAYVFPSTESTQGSLYFFADEKMRYQIHKVPQEEAEKYFEESRLSAVVDDVLRKILFTRALEEYSPEDQRILLNQ